MRMTPFRAGYLQSLSLREGRKPLKIKKYTGRNRKAFLSGMMHAMVNCILGKV